VLLEIAEHAVPAAPPHENDIASRETSCAWNSRSRNLSPPAAMGREKLFRLLPYLSPAFPWPARPRGTGDDHEKSNG
jgi:hypothetical protein